MRSAIVAAPGLLSHLDHCPDAQYGDCLAGLLNEQWLEASVGHVEANTLVLTDLCNLMLDVGG